MVTDLFDVNVSEVNFLTNISNKIPVFLYFECFNFFMFYTMPCVFNKYVSNYKMLFSSNIVPVSRSASRFFLEFNDSVIILTLLFLDFNCFKIL